MFGVRGRVGPRLPVGVCSSDPVWASAVVYSFTDGWAGAPQDSAVATPDLSDHSGLGGGEMGDAAQRGGAAPTVVKTAPIGLPTHRRCELTAWLASRGPKRELYREARSG